MQNTRMNNLRIAEHGAWISIAAYILLSILNMVVAQVSHSASLQANGLNNITDILGNIAILIGLRMARIPADKDHVYGHWKVESIASLITSFIMALVGFGLLFTTISDIANHREGVVSGSGAIVGLVSALVMLGIYLYNRALARRVDSPALLAAAKDNLTDAATSIGTAVAVIAASFSLDIVDKAMALLICLFIFRTAYTIFRDSAFSLSDGFDEDLLADYRLAIESIGKVRAVKMLRGRTYGSNIFLDVVVEMSPDMSVSESHATTEEIERRLRAEFGVFDTDVHVEPSVLPDDERESTLALRLLAMEEALLAGENLAELTAVDFVEIGPDGLVAREPSPSADGLKHYQARRISPKTFLLTYETGGVAVSAIWRRHDVWRCLFRQLTVIRER